MGTKKQYLYRIQPTRPAMLWAGPTPDEAEMADQHFQYLQNLLTEGDLILAGRTQNTNPSSIGIMIFEAESDHAAQERMANDRAVKAGVMLAELYPYRVALMRAS